MNKISGFMKYNSLRKCLVITKWRFGCLERTFTSRTCESHRGCAAFRIGPYNPSVYSFRGCSTLYSSAFIRHRENIGSRILLYIQTSRAQSTTTNTQIPNVIDDLPEPPVLPPSLPTDLPLESGLLEPTLASQGLAGWSPVGLLQQALEFMHISLDMPWWLAIAIGTVIVRILLFPLVILSQRNAADMNNNMPQMQILQMKMTQARTSGNALEAGRYAEELMLFMKEKKLNPLKNALIPMAQAPIFISFFFGLRGMANLPVESFKEGGLWWFTNLTIADPLYILPIITSATLFLTIELGVDGVRADSMQMMKYVLRAIPIVIFPFIMNFPGAILCYWVTSNAVSLVQVGFLRLKPVRAYFKIPATVRHDPSKLPMKKPFVQGFKENLSNARIARELEDRARVDEIRFRKAGMGPIEKTYAYDPTKQAAPTKKTGKKL